MDKFFRLHVYAAEKVFYDGPCESIIVPTIDGKIGILPGHSNLITATVPGIIEFIIPGNEKKSAVISEGIVHVEAEEMWILADTVELPEEIDKKRAELAEQKAKELLKSKLTRLE